MYKQLQFILYSVSGGCFKNVYAGVFLLRLMLSLAYRDLNIFNKTVKLFCAVVCEQ